MIYLSGKYAPDQPVMASAMRNRYALKSPPENVPWAADSGCFLHPERHDDDKYLAWLTKMPLARCLFATAPDVFGEAEATLVKSSPMLPRIRQLGIRAALVAQDGLEHLLVPWDEFDALFLGGSTAWKLSETAARLVVEGKRRGKWVHMGRVNSLRRILIAESMGCDSVDGNHAIFWSKDGVGEKRVRDWQRHVDANPSIWRASA